LNVKEKYLRKKYQLKKKSIGKSGSMKNTVECFFETTDYDQGECIPGDRIVFSCPFAFRSLHF